MKIEKLMNTVAQQQSNKKQLLAKQVADVHFENSEEYVNWHYKEASVQFGGQTISWEGLYDVETQKIIVSLEDLAIQYGIRPNVRPKVVDSHEILTMKIPPRDILLEPWLLSQSLNMLHSARGIGKTWFGANASYAVAAGGKCFGWSAEKPQKVLHIDGEMPVSALQERIDLTEAMSEKKVAPGMLRIITPDLQLRGVPDLSTEEGQTFVNNALEEDTKLIILDNLSCLVRGTGRENEAESWLAVQGWALQMRARGVSVLFIHHSGKSGTQRGTSKKEDLLDVVIKLSRPKGYRPEDGCAFEIHYEKARHLYGDDLKPVEVQLVTNDETKPQWVIKGVEESNFNRVASLSTAGLSQKEISDELGIDKSTVSRNLNKARRLGLVAGCNGASTDYGLHVAP